MADVKVEYNKADLRQILKSFKAMDEEAIDQSKKLSAELLGFVSRGAASVYANTNGFARNMIANTSQWAPN